MLNRLPTMTIRADHRPCIWFTSDVLVARPGTLASFYMGTRPCSHRRGRGDRRERARAIRQGDERLLREPYGDLQVGTRTNRRVERTGTPPAPGHGPIHRGSTWQTVRLSGAHFR